MRFSAISIEYDNVQLIRSWKYSDTCSLRRIYKREWKKSIGDDEKCTDKKECGNKDNSKAISESSKMI